MLSSKLEMSECIAAVCAQSPARRVPDCGGGDRDDPSEWFAPFSDDDLFAEICDFVEHADAVRFKF